MTVMVPERVVERDSCWTKDFCLTHCEGYRVCGPDGTVGYVEEVWLSPEGDVETLLVRGEDYARFEVPAELVEDIDPAADCLLIAEVPE